MPLADAIVQPICRCGCHFHRPVILDGELYRSMRDDELREVQCATCGEKSVVTFSMKRFIESVNAERRSQMGA